MQSLWASLNGNLWHNETTKGNQPHQQHLPLNECNTYSELEVKIWDALPFVKTSSSIADREAVLSSRTEPLFRAVLFFGIVLPADDTMPNRADRDPEPAMLAIRIGRT